MRPRRPRPSASRRPDDHDRRPVRRDQGAARRLLPRRGRRPRRGDRLRRDDPRCDARLASRSGPIWDYGAGAERRRRRPTPADAAADRVRPPPTRSSTACSARSRAGRSRRSSGSSATSTSPRRPSRTRSSRALETWPERGVPANPGAWITTTARNRAIDRLRRRRRLAREDRGAGARGRRRGRAGRHRAGRGGGRRCRSPTTGCG